MSRVREMSWKLLRVEGLVEERRQIDLKLSSSESMRYNGEECILTVILDGRARWQALGG